MEVRNNVEDGLSPMEKEIFKQFKRNIADEMRLEDTDIRLLKWLRAKNFHLRKSEILYRQHIFARNLHKADILEEVFKAPEVFQKYEFANFLGYAKDGTPVRYIDFGRGDIMGFLQSADFYDFAKYCAYHIEMDDRKCREQSSKLGKEIHQISYICDLEGFSLRRMLYPSIIEIALDMFHMLQEYYPEIWRHVFLVNAPPYFYPFFNVLKPILRLNLLQNIIVASKGQTPGVLLKHIDAEVLPVFLGGKRMDSNGDPLCSEFMKFGKMVPEKYFLRSRVPKLSSDEGAEEVWIPARASYNYSVVVREVDSVVRFEARTEFGSLYYILLFRDTPDPENLDIPPPNENLDPLRESHNVMVASPGVHGQTHLTPLSNFFFVPKPGIYIFKFDNSHNWLSGRKLIYRVRVIPPDQARNCEDYKEL